MPPEPTWRINQGRQLERRVETLTEEDPPSIHIMNDIIELLDNARGRVRLTPGYSNAHLVAFTYLNRLVEEHLITTGRHSRFITILGGLSPQQAAEHLEEIERDSSMRSTVRGTTAEAMIRAEIAKANEMAIGIEREFNDKWDKEVKKIEGARKKSRGRTRGKSKKKIIEEAEAEKAKAVDDILNNDAYSKWEMVFPLSESTPRRLREALEFRKKIEWRNEYYQKLTEERMRQFNEQVEEANEIMNPEQFFTRMHSRIEQSKGRGGHPHMARPERCAICQEFILTGDRVFAHDDGAVHPFHAECIEDYIGPGFSCPACRKTNTKWAFGRSL